MSIAHVENAIPLVTAPHSQSAVRQKGNMPRLLLLDTQADSVFNFRGAFIKALVEKGYAVTVATADFNPDVTEKLSELGIRVCRIPFKRTGMNPFEDIRSLYKIYTFIKALQPDVFLGVTIKPSSLGVIAARLAGVPHRFALFTGLGYAFTDGPGIKRRIANLAARWICKFALSFTKATIFQNDDDKLLFTASGLLKESQAARVNGSGIDLVKFTPAPFPSSPFTFLMISRLLGDKGVREYVAAAREIRRSHPEVRFLLFGGKDQNPAAITESELQGWIDEDVIEYGGTVTDVRPVIAACHVFVLPSYYREGIPKVILEALAMARPVITTHTPGCRETVLSGSNGILVPARDVKALVSAKLRLMALSKQDLIAYGSKSRSLAEQKFDINIVIGQLLAALNHN